MDLESVPKAEFRVGDLFETNDTNTYTGANVPKSKLQPGSTPRITATSTNNGIYGYYKDINDNRYRVYENFLTVSFLGDVFYHPYRASVNMMVHILSKLKNHEMTKNIALYMASALRKCVTHATYIDQLSSSDLIDVFITLPVTETGEPDYDFMDAYIQQLKQVKIDKLEAQINEDVNILCKTVGLTREEFDAMDDVELPDIRKVQKAEFRVGDLFETNDKNAYTGANVPKNKLQPGTTPRITTTSYNNGIYGYYKDIDDNRYRVYENFLTVTFLGDVFYHPYRASVNMMVHILSKLKNHEMTTNIALYITSVLRKRVQHANYIDQLSSSDLIDELITLPVTETGEPDWDFMETYVGGGSIAYVQAYAKQKRSEIQKLKQLI